MQGLSIDKTRPLYFMLVVENVADKYVGEEHANYQVKVIKEYYMMSEVGLYVSIAD